MKIPTWNFDKFEGADRTIGLQDEICRRSDGYWRFFQEALHKATQSLEIKRNGLGADGKGYKNYDLIIQKLTFRAGTVFVIYDAMQMGIPLSSIHEITKIDMWFLKQYEELYNLKKKYSYKNLESLAKRIAAGSQTKRICRQTDRTHDGLLRK